MYKRRIEGLLEPDAIDQALEGTRFISYQKMKFGLKDEMLNRDSTSYGTTPCGTVRA
jgi:hypothetical protein